MLRQRRYTGPVLFAVLFIAMSVLGLSPTSARAVEVVSFDNPEHSEIYHSLLREYRCLKCQNQNLADSAAGLAGDLRREIREQVIAGGDKASIDEYLVARYGEFVLYRPRFNSTTVLLWVGPFILLLVGLTALFVMVRNRQKIPEAQRQQILLDEEAADPHIQDKLKKARQLLND